MNEFCLGRMIAVKRNKIVGKDGKKYLAVGLVNLSDDTLGAVRLNVSRYDGDGASLPSLSVFVGGLSEKKDSEFALFPKTELGDNCESCSVAIESASYGDFTFSDVGGKTVATYTGDEPAPPSGAELLLRTGGKTRSVSRRSVNVPIAIGIISFVMLVVIGLITFFQISSFTAASTSFLHFGVEYTFFGGDKSEGSAICVTGYSGFGSEVFIPKEIEGHPVTSVESGAFRNDSRIRSLVIEGSPIVCDGAFEGCDALSFVDLGGVVSVGKRAFSRSGITELKSETLSAVGEEAFSYCRSLKTAEFKSSEVSGAVEIGRNAFSHCGSLTDFFVSKIAKYPSDYCIMSDCKSIGRLKLFNFNYSAVESGAGEGRKLGDLFGSTRPSVERVEITYTDGITDGFAEGLTLGKLYVRNMISTEIGSYAFAGTGLRSLSLPFAVTSVGAGAFVDTGIESFDMTELRSMGTDAFSGCGSLRSVTIPSALKEIPDGAFGDCAALAEVEFEEGSQLSFIGVNAFRGCGALAGIDIPLSVLGISNGAFARCTSLRSIVVPSSVEYIGRGVLAGCTSLEAYAGRLPFDGERFGYYFTSGNSYDNGAVPSSLKKVTVMSAYEIAERMFYGCGGIETVILPSTILTVGDRAFWGMTSLTSLELPYGMTGIGMRAFGKCTSLSSLTVPDSVTEIGEEALYGCLALEELSVPFVGNSIDGGGSMNWFFDSYDSGASGVPSNLKKISVTESHTITENSFAGATYVEEISLGSGVMIIESRAFSNCTSLGKIVLPNSLISIGNNAFDRCFSLYEVYNLSKLSLLGKIEAGSTEYGGVAYYALAVTDGIPDGDLTEYVNIGDFEFAHVGDKWVLRAYNGKESSLVFGSFVYNGSVFDYDIGGGVFDSESGVESVTFGINVSRICSYAFYGCNNLRYVELPESFTESSIGNNAFENCTAIFEVYNRGSVRVQAGVYDDVGLGRYSVAVYSSAADKPKTAELDGFVFKHAGDAWYLVSYNGNGGGIVRLPSSFASADGRIESYSLRPYIMNKVAVDGVVVPKSVENLSYNSLLTRDYVTPTVYYEGNETEWNDTLGGNWYYGSVYLYTEGCVHVRGYWTYENGKVTTVVKPVNGATVSEKEPTCTESGSGVLICDDCGFEKSVTVPALGHDYKDGVCTRCGVFADGKGGENHAETH